MTYRAVWRNASVERAAYAVAPPRSAYYTKAAVNLTEATEAASAAAKSGPIQTEVAAINLRITTIVKLHNSASYKAARIRPLLARLCELAKETTANG